MRCHRIKHWLPLFVGKDLSVNKTEKIAQHLQKCPGCQHEQHMYIKSIETAREWAAAEKIEWGEQAWQQAVKNAILTEGGARGILWPWPFKPVWAYTLMVLFAAAITLLVTTPPFIFKGQRLGARKITPAPSSPLLGEGTSQDSIAVTFVSKETGLEINWIFYRNFDLREDTE